MKLAASNGISTREAPLELDGVEGWSECFITSTSRHVMPVTAIDGRPVGWGRPGLLTARLSRLFEEFFTATVACRA
jgi:branched-subunit amino acid aminotransferase/4-amino-4-deoxychorismate lyase